MDTDKRPSANRASQPSKQTATHGQNSSSVSPNITLDVDTNEPRIQALATTEILEAILEYLPPKQVFAAQRVSKMFQTVIETSPSIQRKLFTRPCDSSTDTWKLVSVGRNQGFPFFAKLDVSVERAVIDTSTTSTRSARPLVMPTSLNPCFLLVRARIKLAALRFWEDNREWVRLDSQQFFPVGQEISIGNSYFTDAACLKVDVRLRIALGPDTLRVSTLVEQDTALTIKDAISGALTAQGCVRLYHDDEEQLYTAVYGVPAAIISEMECRIECEAVLDLAGCQFGLLGLVVPTDQERADVERLSKKIKFHRSM